MILASTIAKWVMVSMFVIGALVTVNSVGKPRRPVTPGTAAWVLAVNAAYVVLIILLWPTG